MHSNSFLIFAPLLVLALWSERRRTLLLPLTILALSLTAWCWRNHSLSGRFTLSTMSGIQLMLQYPISDTDSIEAQWNLWYSSPTFYSVRGYKSGANINRTRAKVDSESATMAKQWLVNHPFAAFDVFAKGWCKLFSFTTEGWLKTPMELLGNSIRPALDALWLMVCLALASLNLRSASRGRQNKARVMLTLAGACLCFFIVSNFWHGDWIGVRGVMAVLPILFVLYLYGVLSMVAICDSHLEEGRGLPRI